jgi:hypothetical protein
VARRPGAHAFRHAAALRPRRDSRAAAVGLGGVSIARRVLRLRLEARMQNFATRDALTACPRARCSTTASRRRSPNRRAATRSSPCSSWTSTASRP